MFAFTWVTRVCNIAQTQDFIFSVPPILKPPPLITLLAGVSLVPPGPHHSGLPGARRYSGIPLPPRVAIQEMKSKQQY